jgi:hypothetical protein
MEGLGPPPLTQLLAQRRVSATSSTSCNHRALMRASTVLYRVSRSLWAVVQLYNEVRSMTLYEERIHSIDIFFWTLKWTGTTKFCNLTRFQEVRGRTR